MALRAAIPLLDIAKSITSGLRTNRIEFSPFVLLFTKIIKVLFCSRSLSLVGILLDRNSMQLSYNRFDLGFNRK